MQKMEVRRGISAGIALAVVLIASLTAQSEQPLRTFTTVTVVCLVVLAVMAFALVREDRRG